MKINYTHYVDWEEYGMTRSEFGTLYRSKSKRYHPHEVWDSEEIIVIFSSEEEVLVGRRRLVVIRWRNDSQTRDGEPHES